MTRKRGGQTKHWAETARVWAWYWQIKTHCDFSDYELDRLFAWTEEGRKERDKEIEGGERGAALIDRPRTFEWIRKKAREPRDKKKSGQGRWRGMTELVDAVEQHPLFAGNKALYNAEIWSMFQETTVRPSLVESRIERRLDAYDLVRVKYEKLGPGYDQLIIEHGKATIFDRCLLLSMRNMHPLHKAELVWCLYIQNEAPHNWEIRSRLESIADERLDTLFYLYLPSSINLDYYSDALHALISTKLDMSSRSGAYGTIESFGEMPVLPRDLVGKIDEELLFAWP